MFLIFGFSSMLTTCFICLLWLKPILKKESVFSYPLSSYFMILKSFITSSYISFCCYFCLSSLSQRGFFFCFPFILYIDLGYFPIYLVACFLFGGDRKSFNNISFKIGLVLLYSFKFCLFE